MKRRIYMDHAATSPTAKEVLKEMKPYFGKIFGNASSLHSFGREAKKTLEEGREKVAKTINAEPDEIYFTSGGTEANNLAIKGAVKKGDHIITSKIEHTSVLETCKALEKDGVNVTYLDADKYGFVDLKQLNKSLTRQTALVTIMHANNEIGTIQPVEKIAEICRRKNVYFHTDAVQTFGKIPIDVKKTGVDMLSASAHKLYGPKGVGMLYMRNGVDVKSMLHGGGHERKLRSGTENVAGIVGFAKACEIAEKNMRNDIIRLTKLRNNLIKGVLEKVPDSNLNGHPKKRLCGNAHFRFKYIEGEALILKLDGTGIAASTGSACSQKDLKPSHVLTAIGLGPVEAHGSLRLTLGRDNTKKDVKKVLKVLPGIVEDLRRISPLRRG